MKEIKTSAPLGDFFDSFIIGTLCCAVVALYALLGVLLPHERHGALVSLGATNIMSAARVLYAEDYNAKKDALEGA